MSAGRHGRADRGPSSSSPTTRRRSASARSQALHERENVVFALIGGDVRHGGGGTRRDAPVPGVCPPERARRAARRVRPLPRGRRRALRAASRCPPRTRARAPGERPVRAVGDDLAPPAHAGARALLPAAAPHLPPRRRDRHLRPARQRLRARPSTRAGPVFEAPQSVDARVLGARPRTPERHGDFQILFAGRPGAGEGRRRAPAWRQAHGTLVLAATAPLGSSPPARSCSARATAELRNLYAGSDVVVVPSVPTRDFLEPWGLVVNEAFHQGVPVIATDAVGAAAGGLVQHERTGLVVPAGDAAALRAALRRLRDDPALRARLGAARARGGRRLHATTPGRTACRARSGRGEGC